MYIPDDAIWHDTPDDGWVCPACGVGNDEDESVSCADCGVGMCTDCGKCDETEGSWVCRGCLTIRNLQYLEEDENGTNY